jgi:hypothetical protein
MSLSLHRASFDASSQAYSPSLALVPSRPRLLARLVSARVLVGLMLAVGLFDLVCTITAYEQGTLDEMNPIARAILDSYGSPGLAVFRFVATSLSCIVLVWALRAYRSSYALDHEARRVRTVIHAAVAVLVTAHVSLVFWWLSWLSA